MNQYRYDEDYYFQISDTFENDKMFILIIYDIIDNKRRLKFAKCLSGYGVRVQKSAFEAMLNKTKYEKLIHEIPLIIDSEDSVRLYKIHGKGQVLNWGTSDFKEDEEIIIV